ncbi:secreted phosphoprotein 24-like [Narcine bancroftii]|uniref:secreted phosphoprotein 24-like n=1 Tax=Narcine bancroftii TaxID=1343680 RepID=UPI003831AC74
MYRHKKRSFTKMNHRSPGMGSSQIISWEGETRRLLQVKLILGQCLDVVEVQDIKTEGSEMRADRERERERERRLLNSERPAIDPTRGRMKFFLLTLAAVQILHCSGAPSTKHALRASVAKLNEITEITNLCGISGRRGKNVYRTGKLSYNVDLIFSVKETTCSKNSGLEFDDRRCHFRSRKNAAKGFCKSSVEYFAGKVVDVDVECRGLRTIDSQSQSLESSENSFEMKARRAPFRQVYKRVKQVKRIVG